MKTYTKHPHCERHKLLRTYSGQVVVSSAALHEHLGERRYQRFIREVAATAPKPKVGFYPEDVERFLDASL